jgi:hypothetical protein
MASGRGQGGPWHTGRPAQELMGNRPDSALVHSPGGHGSVAVVQPDSWTEITMKTAHVILASRKGMLR